MQSVKLNELITILKKLKIPVAYGRFTESVDPPFILVNFQNSNNFTADNYVYKKQENYTVDLVTDKKDVNLEEKLEALFEENKIIWNAFEAYIETERIFQHTYEI